jgi:hypothetical protein
MLTAKDMAILDEAKNFVGLADAGERMTVKFEWSLLFLKLKRMLDDADGNDMTEFWKRRARFMRAARMPSRRT